MQNISLNTTYDFLLGGGEMGELIRGVDWSDTPVGPVEMWPQSLRTAVSIMLNTHFPMYIAWGKEFTQFYNDGYRPILGSTKHPAAMGRSTKFTFAEIWNIIGPMFEGVMEGKAVGFTDFMLPLDRHGFVEECYFIFSYSPIKKEDGSTGGVLVTVTETSDRVLGERRLKTLRELADRTYRCKNLADTSACILQVLDSNKHEIPFSLLYSLDTTGSRYVFEGSSGLDLESSVISVENIIELSRTSALHNVPIAEVFGAISFKDAPWPEVPHQCCICLLSRPDQSKGFGLLVLGISPRLKYDTRYQNFFKLLNDQVVTALTNVHAFEEERKRVEALAEIDRAKTAFFSNISHEFRTPLTLMLGPIEELLHHGKDLKSKEIGNLEVAHRNAIRLLRLVNTLLDFSKIESGRTDATFRVIDLSLFTKDITSNFRSLIEKEGLNFNLSLGTITDSVYVDYSMWEKIVFNLLSNAFKYTLSGSISLGLHQQEQNVVLTVEDTGVGIPQKEIPRIFERFHRIANDAGRSHEGTGIGLSLVAELVKIHQGTITVTSTLGLGSTFTVTIPVGYHHLPAEKTIHELTESYASSIADSFLKEAEVNVGSKDDDHSLKNDVTEIAKDTATILVVEDNGDMIKYLVRLLSKKYHVATASNGRQALVKVAEHKPDLIISDIMMPLMDGVELLKEIKTNADTANIPVMLLSARAGEESRIEGYDVGADDYLTKPFSAKELLARAKAQINISRTRSHLNRLLKQVFQQTPAAIAIIGKENYIVEFANDLYLQIVGRGSEFIGRPLLVSMPELENQVILRLLDEVLSSGIPYAGKEIEIHLHRHGRRDRSYFNFVYHPLREENGSVSGVIVVCFDVTELVVAKNRAERAEADLEEKVKERTAELEEKNQLLSKANAELEQFAYVASHDLQEPLRKIRTFSSILQRNLPDTPQSKQYFEKIHLSAGRMAKLIKDVLNYSRLASQTQSFEPVDLNSVLSSVLVDFELLIEERNAEIRSDILPTISGIELQLHQLFANLVSNALKFSNGRPVLRIMSRVLSTEEMKQYEFPSEHRPYVEIRFEDKGVGFDSKYADQIFVIFQRLHEKETTGTGIGLALCKKIVQNHHGHIRAESSPGNGTVFFVYLPLR